MSQVNSITRSKPFLIIGGILLLIFALGKNPFCWNFECREFTVSELALPDNFFPESDQINGFQQPRDLDGAVDGGSMAAYWDSLSGIAVYIVDRYPYPIFAHWRFNALQNRNRTDYDEDVVLDISSEGNPAFWGCGVSEFGRYRCYYRAIYEEYYVSFVSIIDDEMTYEDFETIVAFIDDQISEKLNE